MYSFGRMVACFRYASIDVLSVYLPPPKLDFYNDDQEWLQKEANEVQWLQALISFSTLIDFKLLNAYLVNDLVWQVHNQAALLFTEVQNAIYKISQKTEALEPDPGTRVLESRQRLAELEEMLQKKIEEFEVKRNLSQICMI